MHDSSFLEGRHGYSGIRDEKLHHHDIALVEVGNAGQTSPPMPQTTQSLNHLAVEYPSLEAWEQQIAFLHARGVPLHRRVARGATHSIHLTDPDGTLVELVFELPCAAWENDIDAALNQAVERPIEGADAVLNRAHECNV